MERKAKAKSANCNESSLGILNVDNLKVFGELSENTSTSSTSNHNNNNKDRRISDRLKIERMKALETLQRSQKSETFKHQQHMANKENMRTSTLNHTPKLDQTDYVPLRRPIAINISELITDETINLENSSPADMASHSKDTKISFEPTEITGRSTLYKAELKQPRTVASNSCRLSVTEILATSFAPKARDLCEALQSATEDIQKQRASMVSSCFTSYNGTHSLPRTADMSLSKASCSELSLKGCAGGFSFGAQQSANNREDSVISSEEFAPGELMQSKLLKDEISWAEEFAAIPVAALSEQAKAKVRADNIMKALEMPSTSNSLLTDDPDFSIGKFFNMRSDNIWDIVRSESPDKGRPPMALVLDDVDDATVTSTTAINAEFDNEATPKVDNKTYSKVKAGSNTVVLTSRDSKHESKDSGHESRNSYLLSISAIDRALCNLDIQTDDSGAAVIDQILSQAKRGKSYRSPQRCDMPVQQPLSAEARERVSEALDCIAELISENKENLDPEAVRAAAQFSDTMSFTDSLLNSSDMKQLQRSSSQPRSPLSPLQISQPQIRVTDEFAEEADIDEWPSTPIKSPQQRVRRTKSPQERVRHTKSPQQYHQNGTSTLTATTPTSGVAKTPTKQQTAAAKRTPSPKVVLNGHTPPTTTSTAATTPTQHGQSFSSTLLSGDKNSVGASPYRAASSTDISNNNTLTTQSRKCGGATPNGCESPVTFEASPVSSPSPRSCVSSPMSGFRSPQLDSTAHSEARYLQVSGGVRAANCSPVASEPGTRSKYAAGRFAAPPHRSCSCTSLKSAGATTTSAARSMSRCSNSSEFSHHAGKAIPLKVTTLSLSWSSTKLRTNVRKSMQVKNTVGKRLVLRMEVSGPGFQIVNAHSNTLTLQSQECRTIIVNFCPTVMGAAVGALRFYAPQGSAANATSTAFLEIPLYAYGGNAGILTQHIYTGPVGTAFLTMGELQDLCHPLERSFKIYNKGPLQGFAIVVLDPSGLNVSRISDTFEVRPQSMLIPAGEDVTVRVIFRPKREDIKKIIGKIHRVLTLANMRVVTGDEANRQRMRRLVQRMSGEERAKMAPGALSKLWSQFPGELVFHELEAFKELPAVSFDLLGSLHMHEIALTINHDSLDETADASSLYFPDGDETMLFHTVCVSSQSPQHMLDPVDELLENTIAHSAADVERAVNSTREGDWSVSPCQLEYDFCSTRRSGRVSLVIRNYFKSSQYFEVVCSHKHWLAFTPSEGYLQPDGGEIEIEVHSPLQLPPQQLQPNEQILVMVSMENERITVPVKLPSDNYLQRQQHNNR